MADLILSPFSSPGGTRDQVIDLTNALETSEILVGPITVTSSEETVITAQGSINTVVLTTDRGGTIAKGKGIALRINTILEADENFYLRVNWTGNSGSAGRYRITVPVQPDLVE